MAMELQEERAYKVYRKLNEVLLSQIKTEEVKEEYAGLKSQMVPLPATNYSPAPEEPEEQPFEITAPEEENRPKYKGFIYARCPECGTARGFCMKKAADHYSCDACGTRTVFENPLVPLQVRCECGRSFRYMTNMTESAFDIPCLECGMPVAVQWNEKKELYETIQ